MILKGSLDEGADEGADNETMVHIQQLCAAVWDRQGAVVK